MRDVRFGLRVLLRGPGLTVAAILTLALSIGATSAVFSLVNAVILRPLPYPEPKRLVAVWETRPPANDSHMDHLAKRLSDTKASVRSTTAERWRELNRSFESLAWHRTWLFNLSGGGDPESIRARAVSADFFRCLGVQPALGRSFLDSEMTPGKDRVAILSDHLWKRRFDADPQVIGQSVTLDGVAHTVVGVTPAGYRSVLGASGFHEDLLTPITRAYWGGRDWATTHVFGRLRPGVSIPQAQAEMHGIATGLESEGRSRPGRGVFLLPLDTEVASKARPALLIALGAIGCVLLIACANLAGLMLTHARARRREVGIRVALGASRLGLVRQMLTECLLLAGAGGALGWLCSRWIARGILLLHPGDLPRLHEVQPDTAVFLFSLVVTAVGGLLFGLLPALQFSSANVNLALKAGGNSSADAHTLAPRRLLVAGEIALALVLLIGAGLLVRSYSLLIAVDPGFRTDGLLTATLVLPEAVYQTPEQRASFAARLLERLETIPAVEAAAVNSSLPMVHRFMVSTELTTAPSAAPPGDTLVFRQAVSTGYLKAVGGRLLSGRDFQPADAGAASAAIINETTARHFWPGEDPVGRQVVLGDGNQRSIIGVTADVNTNGLDVGAGREVFVPFRESPSRVFSLAVRTPGDPAALARDFRSAVLAVDPNQPVESLMTMHERLDAEVASPRFRVFLIGSFAALALVLAMIGIYGVVAYSVTQRTKEIGVRVALGAGTNSIVRMVLREAAALGLAGVVLGLLGAYAASGLLRSYLFGIPPHDALTFATVSALLLAVCLAASYFPARRAARVDPMIALREE